MWSKRTRGQAGDWWLWGLVALSLPLAGISLGILCHPLKTNLRAFAAYSTAVPVYRQGWIPLNEKPTTRNSDFAQ